MAEVAARKIENSVLDKKRGAPLDRSRALINSQSRLAPSLRNFPFVTKPRAAYRGVLLPYRLAVPLPLSPIYLSILSGSRSPFVFRINRLIMTDRAITELIIS